MKICAALGGTMLLFAQGCGYVSLDSSPFTAADGAIRADLGEDAGVIDAPLDAVEDTRVPLDAGDACAFPSRRVASIDADFRYACALDDARSLLCWGRVPGFGSRSAPSAISELLWSSFSVGANHLCARGAKDASCVGSNAFGQLGSGGGDSDDFVALGTLGAVGELAAGDRHSCAIDCEGALWCWGSHSEGQVGVGGPFDGDAMEPLPQPLLPESRWVNVSADSGTSFAIREDGALFAWGRNSQLQLGLGPGAPGQVRSPVRVGERRWHSVEAAQASTCALDEARDLYCWGENMGNIGFDDGIDRDEPALLLNGPISDYGIDVFHGCAVREGQMLCWGRGIEGQLGLGDFELRTIPTPVPGPSDWIDVAVGRFHTCGRRADGSLWCTGDNREGQLGIPGDRRPSFEQIAP